MRPETFWGLATAAAILVPLSVPIYLRAFGRDRHALRFGRYGYRVTRIGSFVYEGSSYRCEDPNDLDETAGRILVEWFLSENGQAALLDCPMKCDYHCVAFLEGYGAGEAWGR